MTGGEIAYLVLVFACFGSFASILAWVVRRTSS